MNSSKKTLLTWIGMTDLKDDRDQGPVVTLLKTGFFSLAHYLFTPDNETGANELMKRLGKQYGLKIKGHRVGISPVDHKAIHSHVTSVLRAIELSDGVRTDHVAVNVTSGTPAMASVMLYLGKLKGLEVLSTVEPKYARKPNDNRVRPVDWDFGLELREAMADKSGEESLVNLKPDDYFNLKAFANQRIGILIEGETGVGKTRLARLIHEWSGREKDRFREQNCAAFHGVELNMAKSEWFGHKKGAYTGGNFDRAGIFMEADGGTVFLDEVGELVPAMQSLLLKILEDKIICPLGGKKEDEKKVDVQIIAATNRDLIREVRAGRFRSDLYYRLSEYPVSLDTLRELSLPIREKLVKDLAIEVIKERNPPGRDLSTAALKLMAAHSWPGNFRQMKQSLARLLLTSRGPVVDEDRVRAELGRPTPETLLQSGERESAPWDGLPLREAVDIFRYQKVQAALNEHNTKTNAAKSLGISVQTLNDYLEAIESKEPSKNGS